MIGGASHVSEWQNEGEIAAFCSKNYLTAVKGELRLRFSSLIYLLFICFALFYDFDCVLINLRYFFRQRKHVGSTTSPLKAYSTWNEKTLLKL